MVLLDTLRMQRRLRAAGMPEEQATLVTEKLASILTEALATKTDMAEVIAEVEDRIGELAPILKTPDM
jgi:hypothetical protein